MPVVFAPQLPAFVFHFDDQGLHVPRDHNIAAPAKNKLGFFTPNGVAQQGLQGLGGGDPHQLQSLGSDAKVL
jgi:hypothetical protein